MGAALFNPQAENSIWSHCTACTVLQCEGEWLHCDDDDDEVGGGGRRRRQACPGLAGGNSESSQRRKNRRKQDAARSFAGTVPREVDPERLEELTKELFTIHDLNRNGLLEEEELISLNERIALLHHGQGFDTTEVRETYRKLFREKLDPDGKPVGYEVFRAYALEVLNGLDDDPTAQEMILEQFVAEAQSGAALLDTLSMRGGQEENVTAGDGAAAKKGMDTGAAGAVFASAEALVNSLRESGVAGPARSRELRAEASADAEAPMPQLSDSAPAVASMFAKEQPLPARTASTDSDPGGSSPGSNVFTPKMAAALATHPKLRIDVFEQRSIRRVVSTPALHSSQPLEAFGVCRSSAGVGPAPSDALAVC